MARTAAILAAFTLIAMIAVHRSVDREASAQFMICYPSGDCPDCDDPEIQATACENIFIFDHPGSCGGGPGSCESIDACNQLIDCASDEYTGSCAITGCTI